jgi:hypothetical protein
MIISWIIKLHFIYELFCYHFWRVFSEIILKCDFIILNLKLHLNKFGFFLNFYMRLTCFSIFSLFATLSMARVMFLQLFLITDWCNWFVLLNVFTLLYSLISYFLLLFNWDLQFFLCLLDINPIRWLFIHFILWC